MSEPSSITDSKLWNYNLAAGLLHLVQGSLMLFASQYVETIKAFKKTITRSYLKFDPETQALTSAQTGVFDVEIGVCAAIFLLMSAFAHFLVLVAGFKKNYIANLNNGINYVRWYEYALSSSVMICTITILFGCYDLGTHICLFLVNASMNLFGLLMEKENSPQLQALRAGRDLEFDSLTGARTVFISEQNARNPSGPKAVTWTPFWFGCIAGSAGWILMALYFFGTPSEQQKQIPKFVYAILASYFIFFNTFPVNMALQYAKVGAWRDYRYGELWYMILSLASKSLLAWLVFGGTFQPNGQKVHDDTKSGRIEETLFL